MPPRLIFSVLLAYASALLAVTQSPPTVRLDGGTFSGTSQNLTVKYLGVPFAKPPVGDLRYRLPVPNDPYQGLYNATAFGSACPQQVSPLDIPAGFQDLAALYEAAISNPLGNGSEDCLTLNIWAPANITEGTKLPVIAWIFGGGFEEGGTATTDPTGMLERAIELGEPFVFVSMNYRVSAFGFLASEEVQAAGVANIGLHDQRQALRWVQKYITAFQGDPSRVTLVGWSAGAISISLQMLANDADTEGLFHGAWMGSGSPIPIGDVSNGQKYYDEIVSATNCSGAQDTLQCLREVPYDVLKQAQDASPSINSYQALNLSWSPRADGTFLPSAFQRLVSADKIARIPFVTGDVDDEGTGFTLWDVNITTSTEFQQFLISNYLAGASEAEVDELLQLYPEDPAQGSPYGTGSADALTPEFKRLSSFHGDLVFQGPRRFFLQHTAERQNTWAFLSKASKNFFPLGSYHGTDTPFFLEGPGMDYIIHFATHLDPNGANGTTWPRYTTANPQLLTVYDALTPLNITQDIFRADAIQFLTKLSLKNPL